MEYPAIEPTTNTERYYILSFFMGVIIFGLVWLYTLFAWGFLFGIMFGWIPALIAGIVGGLLWPLVLACLALLVYNI